MSYKDTDGNIYTSIQDVKISEAIAPASGGVETARPRYCRSNHHLHLRGGWYFYLREQEVTLS